MATALDKRDNTQTVIFNDSVEPRTVATNDVQRGDLWAVPTGLNLGGGAVLGDRIYFLATTVGGAGSFTDWIDLQEWTKIHNIPTEFNPIQHGLGGDRHSGNLDISRIDGHIPAEQTHKVVMIRAWRLAQRVITFK